MIKPSNVCSGSILTEVLQKVFDYFKHEVTNEKTDEDQVALQGRILKFGMPKL